MTADSFSSDRSVATEAATEAARATDWKTVAGEGYPPCDGHTTFIGINSAGYACCFNAMQGGTCVMETAEGAYRQMSDLRDWRLLDRPTRCTRSHPHELMNDECQRLTAAERDAATARYRADTAWLTNE